jgi:hypothetical protein
MLYLEDKSSDKHLTGDLCTAVTSIFYFINTKNTKVSEPPREKVVSPPAAETKTEHTFSGALPHNISVTQSQDEQISTVFRFFIGGKMNTFFSRTRLILPFSVHTTYTLYIHTYNIQTYTHTHLYLTHTHIHIHIHSYTHTHTLIYTYTHTLLPRQSL